MHSDEEGVRHWRMTVETETHLSLWRPVYA